MSDYLTNLAAKSLGLARTIEPRLPSLHEPPPAFETGGFVEAVDALPSPVPRASAEPNTDDEHAENSPLRNREHSQRTHESLKPFRQSLLPREADQSAPEPVAERNSTIRSAIEHSDSSRVEAAGPREPFRVKRDPAAGMILPAPALAIGPPEASAVLLPPSREFVPLISKPDTSPSPDTPAPRQAQPAEPEPAIHVTIGRIEVRAIMPETPPVRSKQERATPKLSLEEYLKQGLEQRR